ncbi:MAG: hypothetical protein ACK4MQ_05450 [Hyphomonas sp.]
MTDTDDIRPPSTLPAFLSLFTSTGTLICCALPALLVSLGAGAVMAGLIEAVPQIVWLGRNKELVFGIAGALLLASGLWQWHARNLPCPADRAQAAACARARKVSWIVWGISVALFVIGAFFAFFAAAIFF